MSLCHETYRRCASVALVLAIVLIALPALLNAQTAPAPKASSTCRTTSPRRNCSLAISGGTRAATFPISNSRLIAFHLPAVAQGFGSNVSCNFTKYLSLEGNYGGNWNRHATNNAFGVGSEVDLSRRRCELFRAHAGRIRIDSTSSRNPPDTASPRFLAAAWISKSGSRSRFGCLKPTTSSSA